MTIQKFAGAFAVVLVIAMTAPAATLIWAESLAVNEPPELPASARSEAAPKGLLADRDNDGISDWLQKKLIELPPNQLLDVIVTFDRPANAQAAQETVGAFKVKRKFWIINGFSANMTVGQVRALARMPGVFRIEENFTVYATLDSANRDFGTAAARSDFGITGNGVGICILDTGIDPNHEQLDGGKVAGFYDFIGTRTTAYDDHGHGTHVGSIAAGDGAGGTNASRYSGVAPGARIYAGKVLNSAGQGTADQIIAGVEWCAGFNEVDIISMSLGSTGSSDGNDPISLAVNNAVLNSGKIAVVAAGNAGSGPYSIGSPGAASEAITVGAAAEWSAELSSSNHSDGIYLAGFSSRGPTAAELTKPDIIAPGVTITAAKYNSSSNYVTYSGTSMATPFVAGTIALALQAYSKPTPSEVKADIMSTAKDMGPSGVDNDWGAGLLDGYGFVSKATGSNGLTPFPALQHQEGFVSTNAEWRWSFDVHDQNTPIAVTIAVEGEPICPLSDLLGDLYCLLGILPWEWSPDLDAELRGPANQLLAISTCMAGDPFDCANMGRQETLHAMPVGDGEYTIVVYPFGGEPNNGMGGFFSVDLSTGPVGSGPAADTETLCSDEIDNDNDGLVDCVDTDCEFDPCCIDSDKDSVLDCDDNCPLDPAKQDPGDCGCGQEEIDSDGDGTSDCIDLCPDDSSKASPGACGCGISDTDTDVDGTADCSDGCPSDPNKQDPGVCGCGVSDTDSDGDGTPDCNDGCPNDRNKTDPGTCGCGVADTDSDNDGTPDCDKPIDSNCTDFCFKNACDGICHPKERGTLCPDCNSTPIDPDAENCSNGTDDDNDDYVDCDDPDCSTDPSCLGSKGDPCYLNSDCQSGKCRNDICR